MTFPTTTRRQALVGAAAVAAGSLLVAEKTAGAATGVGGINAIPPLAAQWNELDLAEILSRPAAYMSVSQNKSLYDTGGAQAAERHRERGSLPATVKVVNAARKASNFKSFSWIGYEVFRENYPQTDFDRVQYASWTKGLNFTPEMKKWDNELLANCAHWFVRATTSSTNSRCRPLSPAPCCRSNSPARKFRPSC